MGFLFTSSPTIVAPAAPIQGTNRVIPYPVCFCWATGFAFHICTGAPVRTTFAFAVGTLILIAARF